MVRRARQGARVRGDDRHRAADPLTRLPGAAGAPFSQQIHDGSRWQSWAAELGGGTVRLIWVRSDAATLYRRLTARGSGRDTAKLDGFTAFTASMRLDAEPAAPHHTIDNRLDASATLEAQVTALIRHLCPEDAR